MTTMNTAINKGSFSKDKLSKDKLSNVSLARLALLLLLFVLFLASIQIAVVSACLKIADQQEVTVDQSENVWLAVAEFLSISSPEVFAAKAKFLRKKAVLVGNEDKRVELLRETLLNLAKASHERPLWPYYSLNELNILVLQDAETDDVRNKVAHIIALAPNERGLDKHFLELAFHSWAKLSSEQQQWMLKRLSIVPRRTLNYVYSVAKNLKKGHVICTSLPYKKIKRLCK